MISKRSRTLNKLSEQFSAEVVAEVKSWVTHLSEKKPIIDLLPRLKEFVAQYGEDTFRRLESVKPISGVSFFEAVVKLGASNALGRSDILEVLNSGLPLPENMNNLVFVALNRCVYSKDYYDFYSANQQLIDLLNSLKTAGVLIQDSLGLSPLMYACMLKSSHGMVSTRPVMDGSIFRLSGSTLLIDEILSVAIHRHQLDDLLAMRNNEHQTIIDFAVERNAGEVIYFLQAYLEGNLEALIYPSTHEVNASENTRIIETITTLKRVIEKQVISDEKENRLKFILKMLNRHVVPISLTQESVKVFEEKNLLVALFGEPEQYTDVQYAIGNIAKFFCDHNVVAPYLQLIEQQFSRYYFETHQAIFPSLPKEAYEFKIIDTFLYPIPKQGYKGISKSSALQEFIMIALRQLAGWGSDDVAYEWLGFVPSESANATLTAHWGGFVTEGRVNEGLLHGKISHMLQLLIIALMIKDNKLGKVTLHQIVSCSLNSYLPIKPEIAVWGFVFDNAKKANIYFGNPYLLHTFIMHFGHSTLNTPSLADSLIDTFCKGFNKLIDIQYKDSLDRESDIADFIERLLYKNITSFSVSPVLVKEYAMAKKECVVEMLSDNRYAILKKPYKPNLQFEFHFFKPSNPHDTRGVKHEREEELEDKTKPMDGEGVTKKARKE